MFLLKALVEKQTHRRVHTHARNKTIFILDIYSSVYKIIRKRFYHVSQSENNTHITILRIIIYWYNFCTAVRSRLSLNVNCTNSSCARLSPEMYSNAQTEKKISLNSSSATPSLIVDVIYCSSILFMCTLGLLIFDTNLEKNYSDIAE